MRSGIEDWWVSPLLRAKWKSVVVLTVEIGVRRVEVEGGA